MKKRCEFCHEWFTPKPRAPHQRSCVNPACRKRRKAAADKKWWLNNQNYAKSRSPKIRTWAKAYPNYWQKYRREHLDYAKKERRRRRSAHQKVKNAAKQDAVRQIAVEKLESIRDLSPNFAAKQDAVRRRIEGILDYLFWREAAAKQDGIAPCLCRAP